MKENFLFKTKPYEHQLTALEKSNVEENYGLFMEMGCGKSKVVIDNFAQLYLKEKINAVLVVAPKGVYDNWCAKEIPTHLPEEIQTCVVKWTSRETKKSKIELEEIMSSMPKLKILVMNVEALSTKKGVQTASAFVNNNKCMFIIDESTTIKNPKAKRTLNAIRIGKYAHYRRILTGSPVTKSPLDLYSQCFFLDPALLGFSSYYAFRARYANLLESSYGGRTFKYVSNYKNLDELNETLEKFSYRVLKKDCLDLPDKVYIKRNIEMTQEQKRLYDDLKKRAIAELQEGTVTVKNVMTKIIRLHQISCGFVTTDDQEYTEIPNNRINELLEILEETDGKVIIWANYRYDIRRIHRTLREKFGSLSTVCYYGDIVQSDRELAISEFQNPDSPVRFFVANTQTGGYGLTLTQASTVVYYSNNYDLEKRLQSEDRAHRIGQENKVTYIDIVCERTVDEKIVRALRKKQSLAQSIMGEEQWKDWLT
jgi:SNF2 family DNA or RNA helicase